MFFYLQQKKILIKSGNSNDMTDLILKRNALAYHINEFESNIIPETIKLPEMLEKNYYECNKCYVQNVCSIFSIIFEKTNDIEDLDEKFDSYNELKSKY